MLASDGNSYTRDGFQRFIFDRIMTTAYRSLCYGLSIVADEQGRIQLSVNELADELHMDDRNLKKYLKQLIREGIVSKDMPAYEGTRKGETNVYQLHAGVVVNLPLGGSGNFTPQNSTAAESSSVAAAAETATSIVGAVYKAWRYAFDETFPLDNIAAGELYDRYKGKDMKNTVTYLRSQFQRAGKTELLKTVAVPQAGGPGEADASESRQAAPTPSTIAKEENGPWCDDHDVQLLPGDDRHYDHKVSCRSCGSRDYPQIRFNEQGQIWVTCNGCGAVPKADGTIVVPKEWKVCRSCSGQVVSTNFGNKCQDCSQWYIAESA